MVLRYLLLLCILAQMRISAKFCDLEQQPIVAIHFNKTTGSFEKINYQVNNHLVNPMPHIAQFKLSKSKFTIAILCATLSVGSATVSNNLPASANRSRLENPNSPVLPKVSARKLIQQIAKDTQLSPKNFAITEVKSTEFDGCLGIYESPRQKCTEILIYGWKVIVTSPTQSYVYHLDRNATKILRNTTASGAKPAIRVSFETFGSISPIASNVIFSRKTSGDLTGRMTNTVLTEDGKIILYQSSPTARFAPQLIKTLSPEQINIFKFT